MDNYNRNLIKWTLESKILSPKMIFIAGPRQIGKTTLVQNFLKSQNCEDLYFNWDTPQVRNLYRQNQLFFESTARLKKTSQDHVWIALDEIHKTKNWKDIIKGYYDTFQGDFRFAVTGSARLDLFRKAGDSLVGRHFLFNLFPLSPLELSGTNQENVLNFWDTFSEWNNFSKNFVNMLISIPPLLQETIEHLFQYGGFPDPCSKANARYTELWKGDYIQLYTREEIRDLSRIHDLNKVEDLIRLLPDRVGSPLSVNSLKEDLEVSYDVVKIWLGTLEKIYLLYNLSPWHKQIQRSMKKEKKYYFTDWSHVPNNGSRFENMIATLLLKFCSAMREQGHGEFELFFIRDLSKQEIDFLITRNRVPLFLAEAKLSDENISPFALSTSAHFNNIPYIQITKKNGILKKTSANCITISLNQFASLMP